MKLISSSIKIILIIFSLQSCSYMNQQVDTFKLKLYANNFIRKAVNHKYNDSGSDKVIMEKTLNQLCEAVPSGQIIEWKNSSNNHRGTFTADKIYKNALGQDCRRYNCSIEIDGKVEQDYGIACRNLNNTWLKVD